MGVAIIDILVVRDFCLSAVPVIVCVIPQPLYYIETKAVLICQDLAELSSMVTEVQ